MDCRFQRLFRRRCRPGARVVLPSPSGLVTSSTAGVRAALAAFRVRLAHRRFAAPCAAFTAVPQGAWARPQPEESNVSKPRRYVVVLAVVVVSSPAFAQSQQIVQRFVGPLDFAAPIVGSLGALAVIGGIVAKGAGQQQGGTMALGAGVLFIIATFLMKTYSAWAGLFFN